MGAVEAVAGRNALHVLHIVSGDRWAGAEVLAVTLIKALARRGDIVPIVLAMNAGELTRRLTATGIETYVIPEDRFGFAAIWQKARRLLRNRRLDVIHAHRYKENMLAALLAWSLRGCRLVSTVHGLPEPRDSGGGSRAPWRHAAVRRLDFALLSRTFDAVVAVSEDLGERLTRQYSMDPSRVLVIRNGVELPIEPGLGPLSTPRDTQSVVIGTVARLVPVKGLDLFLDVAARIVAQVPSTRFRIVGDGPLRRTLESKVEELRLARHVDLVGEVADARPFYRGFDLYLNTSEHEGLPLALLEAMGEGVPVVAPRVGGIPEVVADGATGLLARERSADELANLTLMLVRDPDRRRRLGAAAAAHVRRVFGADGMGAAYAALYRGLAESSCVF